jgi:acyltransferase
MTEAKSSSSSRVIGVDAARGLASILMIQGHAFDAWGSPSLHSAPGYRIESAFLQTLALPAFMVLSGAALSLRLRSAEARMEDLGAVRRALCVRGLRIALAGYALNLVSALLDGWESAATFFRADVLQCIGLSIALVMGTGVRADARGLLRRAWLGYSTAFWIVVPVLSCVWMTTWTRPTPAPWSYAVGLVSEVRGVTRMPIIPLVSWTAFGLALGTWWERRNRDEHAPRGAPRALAIGTLCAAAATAIAAKLLEDWWVARVPGGLSRAHPAVIANAIGLAARGAGVLAAGALASDALPQRITRELARMGRRSIWAYAFHVPLCYGALGAGLAGQLDAAQCTAAALGLVALSYGVVRARDAVR